MYSGVLIMKEIAAHKLKEGMVIAENVMTKGGQRILNKGKVLTKQSIMRLSFYNIKAVMIEDAPPEVPASATPPKTAASEKASVLEKSSTPEEKPVRPQFQTPEINTSRKFHSFQIDHTIVLASIRESFENYVNNGVPFDTAQLLSLVRELFTSCKTSLELLDMLHNMHSTEDSIYAHSLNVSIICRQIGKWMKLDADTLDTLTLAGLLHDIGKLKIPAELLNKPGKYTDEEFHLVQMHTRYGYDLLSPLPLDSHIKHAALSHHERCDCSGYPMGLAPDDTDDYAMVVAIADVYDAMTTARSYRAPLCPFEVIERFEQEGLQKYKPKYILTFLGHVAGTYQNHRILLSDGRSATVVMLNQQRLSKPIVKLDDGNCIDLSTEKELHIQAVM